MWDAFTTQSGNIWMLLPGEVVESNTIIVLKAFRQTFKWAWNFNPGKWAKPLAWTWWGKGPVSVLYD